MSVKNFNSKIPNTEKLFTYLQKEVWQNVSATFTGFVKKEFESSMLMLEEDEENYKHLKMMIECAELGRYNDAKRLIDPAYKEFQDLENAIQERQVFKHKLHQRPGDTLRNAYDDKRHQTYTPNKNLPMTPKGPVGEDYVGKRDTFGPTNREMGAPQRRDGNTPNMSARPGYPPDQYSGMDERGPRTPQKDTNSPNPYDDPHRLNFDNLRMGSSDKGKPATPDGYGQRTPNGRINSGRSDTRQQASAGFSQFQPSKDNYGQNEREKVGSSTYRQEFPGHVLDSYERQDKNRYKENFGSATQRDFMHYSDSQSDYKEEFSKSFMVGKDVKIKIQAKKEKLHRLQDTPDEDRRPSELARRFKDIYVNEWADAYDEIVKTFGPEKAVRHLLWIVTEAWLIALELGDKQLRDLEKSTFSIMSHPGSEHRNSSGQTRDLGESLPTSRNLLLKYRKQTATLSIPYVKQVCQEKICQTLLEKSGFPKMFLTDASKVVAYILKCAEVVWLMSVQDPPIVLEYITRETEGARFNTEHYHTYTSPGSIYKFGVWPLLRLDKRGPIIAKGIAQGIQ